ncbi:MAG: hypothetical protein ACK46Q_12785 [Hyphomonas sp.]
MQPSLKIELDVPEWLGLLQSERDRGKSVSTIARETGMARASVSMLLSGTYPARSLDLVTRKHGARIVKLYRNQVLCPHLRRGIGAAECEAFAAAPMSTSNPEKLKHWRCCRQCPLNPTKPANEEN